MDKLAKLARSPSESQIGCGSIWQWETWIASSLSFRISNRLWVDLAMIKNLDSRPISYSELPEIHVHSYYCRHFHLHSQIRSSGRIGEWPVWLGIVDREELVSQVPESELKMQKLEAVEVVILVLDRSFSQVSTDRRLPDFGWANFLRVACVLRYCF